FREDVLYRLNTVEIRLPPLRDRGDDILRLAAHYLKQYAQRYRSKVAGFDSSAQAALRAHTWPGNVRELQHAIERAVLMAHGDRITARDLGLYSRDGAASSSEDMTLEEAEK